MVEASNSMFIQSLPLSFLWMPMLLLSMLLLPLLKKISRPESHLLLILILMKSLPAILKLFQLIPKLLTAISTMEDVPIHATEVAISIIADVHLVGNLARIKSIAVPCPTKYKRNVYPMPWK